MPPARPGHKPSTQRAVPRAIRSNRAAAIRCEPGRRWQAADRLDPRIQSPRSSLRRRTKEATRGRGCPSCPSESSAALLAPKRCRLGASSRNWLLVQSSEPDQVPQLLVLRSHSAVGRFLGFVVFPGRAVLTTLSSQYTLSSSSAFLQSLAQRDLAGRPEPTDSSHGLLLPSALGGPAVHLPRALPRPATFRLQGLTTLWAAFSRRARAGFVSHRRRSWDSPFGAFSSRKVSGAFANGRTHVPFNPPVFPPPKRWAGPTGRGFWALTLPGVPGRRTGVSSPAAGCSLGLRPSRVYQLRPGPGCNPNSSHALCPGSLCSDPAPAPRSINRPPLGPAPRVRQAGRTSGTTLVGFSHPTGPGHLSEAPPGLCVHLVPRRASLPAGRHSLGGQTSLDRSCSGRVGGAEHLATSRRTTEYTTNPRRRQRNSSIAPK
jgi:hypothetical protein